MSVNQIEKRCSICHSAYLGHKNSRYCSRKHLYQCSECGAVSKLDFRRFKHKAYQIVDINDDTVVIYLDGNKCKSCTNRETYYRKSYTHYCQECGEEFKTRSIRGYYCDSCKSDKSDRAFDEKKRTCIACGDEFLPRNFRYKLCRNREHYYVCSCCGKKVSIQSSVDIPDSLPYFLLSKDNRESIITFIQHTCHKCNTSYIRPQTMRMNMLDRYGVDHVFKLPEVREKIKQTTLDRYGVDSVFKLERVKKKAVDALLSNDTQDRIARTNLERYGSIRPFGNPEIQEKALKRNYQTISKINLRFKDRFENLGYKVELEKMIGRYSYDMILDDTYLVDINPTVSHNSTISFKKFVYGIDSEPISKTYHVDRLKNAVDNGYRLFSYFELYDIDYFIETVDREIKNDLMKTGDTISVDLNIDDIRKYDSYNLVRLDNTPKILDLKGREVEVYDCGVAILDIKVKHIAGV